jgi:hypothetical protein
VKAVLLGLALVVGASVAGGASTAVVALAPVAAPAVPLFALVPAGGFPDRFPFGQCTWWVAFNRRVTWGGNARDWLANAAAQGMSTSEIPSVGAIAVYRPGGPYSEFGHVAVVVAVKADTYTVSEMNATGWGQVSRRDMPWPDPHVAGFIPTGAGETP